MRWTKFCEKWTMFCSINWYVFACKDLYTHTNTYICIYMHIHVCTSKLLLWFRWIFEMLSFQRVSSVSCRQRTMVSKIVCERWIVFYLMNWYVVVFTHFCIHTHIIYTCIYIFTEFCIHIVLCQNGEWDPRSLPMQYRLYGTMYRCIYNLYIHIYIQVYMNCSVIRAHSQLSVYTHVHISIYICT